MRASRGAKPRRRGLGDGPEPETDTHLPLTPSPPHPRQTETPITSPKLTSPYITSPSPHPTYLPHPPPRRLTFPISLPHLPHHPNDYLTSPLTSPPRMTSYPPRIPTSPSPDLLPPSPTPSFRKEHSDLLSSTRPTEPGTYPTPTSSYPSSYPYPYPSPRPTPPLPPRTYLRYLPPRRLSPPLVSRLPKSLPTDTMYDVIQVTPVTCILTYTLGSRHVCSIHVFPSNSPKCMLHTLQISLSPSRREGDRHIDIGGPGGAGHS